jgi:Spy/CpxP family protein refolding chaperone
MKPLRSGRVVVSSTTNQLPNMKTPLKFLLPFAGFALLTSPLLRAADPADAPADKPDRQERRAEMRENGKKWAEELNLTADQQTRVDAIRKQTADAIKALHKDTTLTDDQKKAKGRELRATTEQDVMAVLTPEQQAKAKELRAKRMHKHGDHAEDQAAPPPPADKPATN